MQLFHKLYVVFFSLIILTSCSTNNYQFKISAPNKVTLSKDFKVSFDQIAGDAIDSAHIYINKKLITNNTSINSSEIGVGKHEITALAFYPGKVEKNVKKIEIVANAKPEIYNYNVINTYPHDPKAYTQGLEYHDGYLYETTGRKGQSWLRKVDIKTGEVLQQKDLDEKYFGEGMTIFDATIYWLTWHANKGFTYNLSDFESTGEFEYKNSFEGWGLTHNKTELIKSDGTNKIWFLDPITKQETRNIQAYTNKYAVDDLNELEYINGKIYANKWQQNSIVIINPKNGVIEGIANLNGLRDIVAKQQKLDKNDDVLNGIAYDNKNNRLFVTGKHWNKLFEIELIKK